MSLFLATERDEDDDQWKHHQEPSRLVEEQPERSEEPQLATLDSTTSRSGSKVGLRPSIYVGAPTNSMDAWISTIKGIAVCWAIVAFIWIFCRIMAGANFCCQLWMYRRHPAAFIIDPSSAESGQQGPSVSHNAASSGIRAELFLQRQLLMPRRWINGGERSQPMTPTTGHSAATEDECSMEGDQRSLPEYSQFLPPSYDEVMQLERLGGCQEKMALLEGLKSRETSLPMDKAGEK